MQLNVTSDYGLRVVLYLAQKNGVASSNEICAKMGIPRSYMHKVAKVLKSIDAICEVRGVAGGFVLNKDPSCLTLLTILSAFEKSMNVNRCLEKDAFCSRAAASYCRVRELYVEVQAEFNKKLDIPLSALLSNRNSADFIL